MQRLKKIQPAHNNKRLLCVITIESNINSIIMKAIQIDTMTCGQQFLPAIFNGDVECLSAHEEFLLEREVKWYNMEGEEDYPNFVSIEFECKSSERHICGCDLTGLLSECVEVKVFVMLDENYVKD